MDNSPEMEKIEWDIPVSEMQNSGKEGSQENWLDFSKLSLGTEMRNKIWEDENKEAIGFSKVPGYKGDTKNSFEPPGLMNGKLNQDEQLPRGKGPFFGQTGNHMFDFNPRNNMRNGFHGGGNNFLNPNSPSFSPSSFMPSNHGQVTSPAEESVNNRGENRFGVNAPNGELRVGNVFLFSRN